MSGLRWQGTVGAKELKSSIRYLGYDRELSGLQCAIGDASIYSRKSRGAISHKRMVRSVEMREVVG